MAIIDLWNAMSVALKASISGFEGSHTRAKILNLLVLSTFPPDIIRAIDQQATSKAALLDLAQAEFEKLPKDAQQRIASNFIHDILSDQKGTTFESRFLELLERFGWGISDGQPYPIQLLVDVETIDLPDEARDSLLKGLRRYRDGDMAGAVTSICGAVERLTPGSARGNYAEAVRKAYEPRKATFVRHLTESGVKDDEAELIWTNQLQSVTQAAHVLAKLRRHYADAHGGDRTVPGTYLQHAVDSAVYLVRCLTNVGSS